MEYKSTNTEDKVYLNASGPVNIRLTNDYLFRALMQTNNEVCKALICALLHIDVDTVKSVEITNPIELGETFTSKNFILDIKVILNGDTIINLEIQVLNEYNWPERSLCYLCRSFDNLNKGEDYFAAKTAVQIGLLDFTLFPEMPEFFASYRMMNTRNHKIYSDKMQLFVLNLSRIDLATEEDRDYRIDYWAKLFKSTTWEELKMVAEKDSDFLTAVNSIYKLTQEEKIRQQCEAREEYYRIERTRQKALEYSQAKLNETVEKLNSTKEELDSTEEKLSSTKEKLNSTEEKLSSTEAQLGTALAEIERLRKLAAANGIQV